MATSYFTVPNPDLANRTALCMCGRSRPSEDAQRERLNFIYRGPGSFNATENCMCGYYRIAHEHEPVRLNPEPIKCKIGGFTARGDMPDQFWCGCGGTD